MSQSKNDQSFDVLIRKYWRRVQIPAVRFGLFVLLVASFFPKMGAYFFPPSDTGLSVLVGIAFVAFEVMVNADKRRHEEEEEGVHQTRGLSSQLEQAFQSREVRLEIFCYSAETFFSLLAPMLSGLEGFRAKKITIRVLIRDVNLPFLVPCDREWREDGGYRARIVERNKKIISDFYSVAGDAQRKSPDRSIDFEIRMHRFEPFHKGIILNRERVHWALYPITISNRYVGGQIKEIWDYEGHSANLLEFSGKRAGVRSHTFWSISSWFETVWDNFSKPVSGVLNGD